MRLLPGVRALRAACAAALTLAMAPAAPRAEPVRAGPELEARDPLVPMLRRIDRYLQRSEQDGVVLDWRWVINETEAVRLSIQPQLLGYVELYRWHPTDRIRQDIVDRADYLLARFDQVRSSTVFDGMLGYCFFEAFDVTGDTRYFDAGRAVIAELESISRSELILNGGLMAAMAFAANYALTGDVVSEGLAKTAIASLPPYQHEDGCFPHWCYGTRDISYTDWMAMELILIQRRLDDPTIAPILQKIEAFMETRVDSTGDTSYEAPCPDEQGCTIYYWSVASGCDIDYDTRAFTNELGYSALLFDHFHSPKYRDVMRFMRAHEKEGTWADKWNFWPDPSDPYYVWTAADTSVVNISLNFWCLAAALPGRSDGAVAWGPDSVAAGTPPGRPTESPGWATPNPSRGAVTLRFVPGVTGTASASGEAPVAIFDAAGRRVRALRSARDASGGCEARWDGRDESGAECGSGLYFARVGAGADARVLRLLRVR
jgi:flagellar hook capping protein FlgD